MLRISIIALIVFIAGPALAQDESIQYWHLIQSQNQTATREVYNPSNDTKVDSVWTYLNAHNTITDTPIYYAYKIYRGHTVASYSTPNLWQYTIAGGIPSTHADSTYVLTSKGNVFAPVWSVSSGGSDSARIADSSRASHYADSSAKTHFSDSGKVVHFADSSKVTHFADSSKASHVADTALHVPASSPGNLTGDVTSVGLATTYNNTLGTTKGGTGLTGYTTGDLPYASATNVLSALAIGTTGQLLVVSGGVPTWSNTITGAQTFELDNLTTTTSPVLTILNGTAATSGVPVQVSPAELIQAHVWYTNTTAHDSIHRYRTYVLPVSGNPGTSSYEIDFATGNSAWHQIEKLQVPGSASIGSVGTAVGYGASFVVGGTAIGYNAAAQNTGSIAISSLNDGATATGNGSVAIGGATASNLGSVAIGSGNGYTATSGGSESLAINGVTSGDGSNGTSGWAIQSAVFGAGLVGKPSSGGLVGCGAIGGGADSVLGSYAAAVNARGALLFGYGGTAVGQWNDPINASSETAYDSLAPAFIVGCGTGHSDHRNAFYVTYGSRMVIPPRTIGGADAGITLPTASVVQINHGTETGAFAITLPTGVAGAWLIIMNNTSFATTGTAISSGATESFVYLNSAWQHIQ